MKFYNSFSNKLEVFKPLKKVVGLYTCGPTVYNYAHIGNFRAYVWEDILKRYLLFSGYKVKHIMNLTDVDDKTIKGSNEEKLALNEFTEKYKKAFFEDIKTLNILEADEYPAATDHIGEIVDWIAKLVDKEVAYKGDDESIYFSLKKFPNYGKLTNIDPKKLRVGVRINVDEYEKENVGDFALWKAWDEKDGAVFWETKLGKGRPGWHIECSVMSTKFLGETFDIHTGGVDNKFPHHENEIAQNESLTGNKFVKYWLHCEHLLVEGKKMAKSEGNYYTLRDLIKKGISPKAIRFELLNSNYRQPLNFTFEAVTDSGKALKGLQNLVDRLKLIKTKKKNDSVEILTKRANEEFVKAMDNDLNVPKAMSAIFEFATNINKLLDEDSLGEDGAKESTEFLKKIDSVLGLLDFEEKFFELSDEQKKLVEERNEARNKKNFAKSDEIRNKLKEQGILLVDNKDGSTQARPLN